MMSFMDDPIELLVHFFPLFDFVWKVQWVEKALPKVEVKKENIKPKTFF